MDGSEEMCKLAEVNTDKEVLQMTYDEMEFDDVFDGIWACASLIHLTEDEMRKVMKKLVQALRKTVYFIFPYIEATGMESIMDVISMTTTEGNCRV